MAIERNFINVVPFLTIFCFASLSFCTGRVIIDDERGMRSEGKIFKLSFFSPRNSSNRYVGISYNNIRESVIVWIANREKPVTDSSGILRISDNGNLEIIDGRNSVKWSSNVMNIVGNTTVKLLDSGNLVLYLDNTSGTYLWESFRFPTNALLSTMKIGINPAVGEKRQLTSWKNNFDPSIGDYSFELDPVKLLQGIIWAGSKRHWRTGPWNNQTFIGISDMDSVNLSGLSILKDIDQKGSLYMTVDNLNTSVIEYVALSSNGTLVQRWWDEDTQEWIQSWLAPKTKCDIYSICGPFGICDEVASPICRCLRGFKPKSENEWRAGNWSGGCARSTQLRCEINSTIRGKEDQFMKFKNAKVPDFANWGSANNLEECRQECLKNCSCLAHSYASGIGCMIWNGTLLDMQKFTTAGVNLYIREAAEEKKATKPIIIISVIVGVFSISVFGWLLWRWMSKKRGKKMKRKGKELEKDDAISVEVPELNMFEENPELPVFNIKKLVTATNNFNVNNKLGEGGFGSVYKGIFPSGQVIAVKRLSKSSHQGLTEFKNEVIVISKLQHRNLVRLVGCCIEGEEKMLIYEYLSNSSLDVLLFDANKRALLDWRKRFQIIEGICRGILYLHRDSTLRVIHRDLKASNILLDEELNPKISDFGMARIFGRNELQANTVRVVGTYGYMSPEYAMKGFFSEKSDVFSLGVLLLEIVSGKKNTGFHEDSQSLCLLEHAWNLWNGDNVLALIDPVLSEKCFQEEMLRCIHVGLLCVQEYAQDRPIVSTVLSMLTSEVIHIPAPKKPAFTGRRIYSDTQSSLESHNQCSLSDVSFTMFQGR